MAARADNAACLPRAGSGSPGTRKALDPPLARLATACGALVGVTTTAVTGRAAPGAITADGGRGLGTYAPAARRVATASFGADPRAPPAAPAGCGGRALNPAPPAGGRESGPPIPAAPAGGRVEASPVPEVGARGAPIPPPATGARVDPRPPPLPDEGARVEPRPPPLPDEGGRVEPRPPPAGGCEPGAFPAGGGREPADSPAPAGRDAVVGGAAGGCDGAPACGGREPAPVLAGGVLLEPAPFTRFDADLPSSAIGTPLRARAWTTPSQ